MPFPLDIAKILVGWLYWHLPLQQVMVELSNLTARRNGFNNEADAFVSGSAQGVGRARRR